MQKFIIIIAGATASGKSRLSNYLSKELGIICINKDMLKEILVDSLGYSNREENKKLSETAFYLMLGIAEKSMLINNSIMLESNFRVKEQEALEKLIYKYNYIPLTIFLHADLNVLHKRYLERVNSGTRHIAHLSFDATNFDDFYENIKQQLEFKIKGKRLNINTTDFRRLHYGILKDKINKFFNDYS